MTAAAPIALPAMAKKRRRLVSVESEWCDMVISWRNGWDAANYRPVHRRANRADLT
jgi:hypothetical protein